MGKLCGPISPLTISNVLFREANAYMNKKDLQIESVFLEGVMDALKHLERLVSDRYADVQFQLSEFGVEEETVSF